MHLHGSSFCVGYGVKDGCDLLGKPDGSLDGVSGGVFVLLNGVEEDALDEEAPVVPLGKEVLDAVELEEVGESFFHKEEGVPLEGYKVSKPRVSDLVEDEPHDPLLPGKVCLFIYEEEIGCKDDEPLHYKNNCNETY